MGTAADTLTVPYNDLAAVEKLLGEVGDQVAAIIVEPGACTWAWSCLKPTFWPACAAFAMPTAHC